MAGMTVATVTIIPLALPTPAGAIPAGTTNSTGGPATGCGRPAATGAAGSQERRRSPASPTSVAGTEDGSDTIDGGAGIDEARTGTSAGVVVELTRRRVP